MQVQVRINEEGALRNQRYAFTDRFTLISELMQNARRAGAQRIAISYDEESRILRVVDDGCGIDWACRRKVTPICPKRGRTCAVGAEVAATFRRRRQARRLNISLHEGALT